MQRYETYKPSGAEWLGDIPGHWALLPAKRLFREISEKDHPNAELLSVTQGGFKSEVQHLQTL